MAQATGCSTCVGHHRNFKDAYEGFRGLALDPKTDPKLVGTDLNQAIQCLDKLGRVEEIDEIREAVVAVHRGNWRLLQAAAESYLRSGNHAGTIVAGKFLRGKPDGRGRYVGAFERDRASGLQLLVQGLDRARSDPDRGDAARYYLTLARTLMGVREQWESWRLQSLTPLDVLPDYEENAFPFMHNQSSLAPVAPDGTRVYYRVPESFEKAKNDGERWRWAL